MSVRIEPAPPLKRWLTMNKDDTIQVTVWGSRPIMHIKHWGKAKFITALSRGEALNLFGERPEPGECILIESKILQRFGVTVPSLSITPYSDQDIHSSLSNTE